MTTTDAYDYLLKNGNLRVPGSRYGYDTADCAAVAVRVWELLLPELPESEPVDLLEQIMGLVVNDHDDPEYTLRHYGTADDHARFEVPIFVVIENTPGYMPDSDDPVTFTTFGEARQYAKQERDNLVEFHREGAMDDPDYELDLQVTEDIGDDYAIFYVARNTDDLGRVITVERIED